MYSTSQDLSQSPLFKQMKLGSTVVSVVQKQNHFQLRNDQLVN